MSEGTLLLSQQIMDIVGFLKSQFICHLLICYIFIVSGLIINFIQLFTLILWPINKQLFRKINCRLAYCISSRKISFFFLSIFVFCVEGIATKVLDFKAYVKVMSVSYSTCTFLKRCMPCQSVFLC